MEHVQATAGFADIFENLLVPAIFGPYAHDLVERARPFGPSDRVLDLGCGTGIVARVLRDRLGAAARIVGVDRHPDMIAKARSLAPALEWREADAAALPFGDGSFDVVLAQQVLQFVPDPSAATREIARVLAPGGRVFASTWRPRAEQPLFEAVGRLAERHLGPAHDRRFALDGDALVAAFAAAGLDDVRRDTASLIDRHAAFPVRGSTLAAAHDLAALAPEERERRLAAIEAEAVEVLAGFADARGGYAARSVTNVVTARKPHIA